MKILKVTPITSEIILTDDREFPTYRRNGPDDWENLMGESWEPMWTCGRLEAIHLEVPNLGTADFNPPKRVYVRGYVYILDDTSCSDTNSYTTNYVAFNSNSVWDNDPDEIALRNLGWLLDFFDELRDREDRRTLRKHGVSPLPVYTRRVTLSALCRWLK